MNRFWQIAIGIAGGLLAAGALMLAASPSRGEPVQLLPAPSPAPIVVQVSGAVAHPDLYSLPPNSRVVDAVDAAGGLLPQAYTENLNLAARLQDGQKLVIPFQHTASPEGYQPPGKATPTPAVSYPININTADVETLSALPGIGPVKAQAIIDYRIEHGDFSSIEQIQLVSGIDPATFDKIKDLISVGDNP